MIWQPMNLTSVCPSFDNISTVCSIFGPIYLNLIMQLYGDRRLQRIYKTEKVEEEYDFIVVGAGTAGCVVANRLTEIPGSKVLLLEAGPDQPDVTLIPGIASVVRGSNIDWAYHTEPDSKSCLAKTGGRCSWPRGKVMGGSSTINSMYYLRGSKVDFDDWAAAGIEGWSYDDVLPYFKKSEDNLNIALLNEKYHRRGGEQKVSFYSTIPNASKMVVDAFNEKGVHDTDFNGPYLFGSGIIQVTAAFGKRVSTNTGFIDPIRLKRKNLIVQTNCLVEKVLINEENRAYGVIYTKNGEEVTVRARKEVILSAGSINTPKLLMLSGIGPKKHLEEVGIKVVKDLPVGENLQDHVTLNAISIALSNKTSNLASNGDILKQIYDYGEQKGVKTGPLSADGPLPTIAYIKTDPNLKECDIQYNFGNLYWREFVKNPVEYDKVKILPTAYYDGLLVRIAVMDVQSRGKLTLDPANVTGAPLIYPNYFSNQSDLETIVKGTKFLLSLGNTNAFKCNGAYFVKTKVPACRKFKFGSDSYIRCIAKSYTDSSYHPVGTCRMGAKDDTTAVVDPKLKVKGVNSLRIIDASVMYKIPRANTNAASLMIGEKGADLVKEDYTIVKR